MRISSIFLTDNQSYNWQWLLALISWFCPLTYLWSDFYTKKLNLQRRVEREKLRFLILISMATVDSIVKQVSSTQHLDLLWRAVLSKAIKLLIFGQNILKVLIVNGLSRVCSIHYRFTYKEIFVCSSGKSQDDRIAITAVNKTRVVEDPVLWLVSIVPSVNTNCGHLEFHTTQSVNMLGLVSSNGPATMIIKLSASL